METHTVTLCHTHTLPLCQSQPVAPTLGFAFMAGPPQLLSLQLKGKFAGEWQLRRRWSLQVKLHVELFCAADVIDYDRACVCVFSLRVEQYSLELWDCRIITIIWTHSTKHSAGIGHRGLTNWRSPTPGKILAWYSLLLDCAGNRLKRKRTTLLF